ncbi:methionine synthase [Roseovarius sp. C7]|uniref:methionine synthase n=1 Tax=Roseovarius sp. C7 TaxID=3398643 RepID=UPI0039F55060
MQTFRKWAARLLYWLAALGGVLWIVGYIYIAGMACAYGAADPSNCGVPSPWTLGREDFTFLVAIPLGFIAALVLLGWLISPRRASLSR